VEKRKDFLKRVNEALERMDTNVLSYNQEEYWMIRSAYEYVEYYASSNQLWNTCLALPLARGLHDGTHRKASVIKEGEIYRVPYLIHPLEVCRMLIDLQIPISKQKEDILLASAMCHDMLEDIPFEQNGMELITEFHLDPEVLETVKLVSKRQDFTEEEEREFFTKIEGNELATLIKLSDRGNNVEDLYNMSLWKVHEYASETRKFFVPMCEHARENYPELLLPVQMLQNKMVTLINAAETLADRYAKREAEFETQLKELREENVRLRRKWQELWFEE